MGGRENGENAKIRNFPPARPGGRNFPPRAPPARGPPQGGSGGSQRGVQWGQSGSPLHPQKRSFWAFLVPNIHIERGGPRGIPKMGVPYTMFVPAMFVQKTQKNRKNGSPCLSRMGDLLNTQRNVHFFRNFPPRGVFRKSPHLAPDSPPSGTQGGGTPPGPPQRAPLGGPPKWGSASGSSTPVG